MYSFSPHLFLTNLQRALASTIISIAYGIKISGFDDPYIVNIEESSKGFNLAGIPGSFLVDLIPALKYVPSWFPGAGFKKIAEYYVEVNRRMVELPFNHVVRQIVRTSAPTLRRYHLSDEASRPDRRKALRVQVYVLA